MQQRQRKFPNLRGARNEKQNGTVCWRFAAGSRRGDRLRLDEFAERDAEPFDAWSQMMGAKEAATAAADLG